MELFKLKESLHVPGMWNVPGREQLRNGRSLTRIWNALGIEAVGLCQNAPLARMRRWRKNLKCTCTTCTLRFQNFSPPCLQTKSIILTHPQHSDTVPVRSVAKDGTCAKPDGGVLECAFGPHAALAKKPEMHMYNMYTPLSELFAALPADQIHHSDPPPAFWHSASP